jgi:hypothetical protein
MRKQSVVYRAGQVVRLNDDAPGNAWIVADPSRLGTVVSVNDLNMQVKFAHGSAVVGLKHVTPAVR